MTLKRAATWILLIMLALEFALAGLTKFRPGSAWPRMFAQWGFPFWVWPIVGAAEVLGAIGLLWRRTRRAAATMLIGVMAAAAITHLVHAELRRVLLPLLLGVLLWLSRRVVTD